jgi:hypothetical protein
MTGGGGDVRESFLVLRAQSGDREALDALLSSVREPLYRYALSLVGERNFKLAFFAAVVFEALFLVVFVAAADLSNRTHLLLLIATVGGYTVVVRGLLTLGAHVSRVAARLLKAVELLDR